MTETLRSIVHPWECDAVEHFTTAYYFQAYDAARWHLLQILGYGREDISAMVPLSCRTGFSRELRAGDAYHIESGVMDSTADSLTIGNRLYNSETGELGSSQLLRLGGDISQVDSGERLSWEDDTGGSSIDFASCGIWSTTSRMTVRERDLDHTGRLDLCTLIHHTSDANVQFQNMIGMTSSYMHERRIGFSTFAYDIQIHALPRRPGTLMRTDSALAHLGRTSLRFAHRVVDHATGMPIADVAQMGVHLDRAARAPSPIPDEIRGKAEGFLDKPS